MIMHFKRSNGDIDYELLALYYELKNIFSDITVKTDKNNCVIAIYI